MAAHLRIVNIVTDETNRADNLESLASSLANSTGEDEKLVAVWAVAQAAADPWKAAAK